MLQFRNSSRVMEAETISKNDASSKSQMSRRNIMQKTFLFIAALCVSVSSTFAQDIITLKNGEDIQALVQEIGEVDIKYKKIDNPNGPNYTLKKSEILIIRYVNGSKDIFSEEEKSVEKKDFSISDSLSLKSNNNSSTNKNFVLKKSAKIMIASNKLYKIGDPSKKMSSSLEKKLKELNFCCVYQYGNIDKELYNINDTTANISIIVFPTGNASRSGFGCSFRFQILDNTLHKEVFDLIYSNTTINKVINNFIKDISPFIEE